MATQCEKMINTSGLFTWKDDENNIQDFSSYYYYKDFSTINLGNKFGSSDTFTGNISGNSSAYSNKDPWNDVLESKFSIGNSADNHICVVKPGTKPSFSGQYKLSANPVPDGSGGTIYHLNVYVDMNKPSQGTVFRGYGPGVNPGDTSNYTIIDISLDPIDPTKLKISKSPSSDPDLSGTDDDISFSASDFQDGVLPKRLLIELQSAGGGGCGGDWGMSGKPGAGGGSGAYWLGILDISNIYESVDNVWRIYLPYGGKRGENNQDGHTNNNATYIETFTWEDDDDYGRIITNEVKRVVLNNGKGALYNETESTATGGAGGTIGLPQDTGLRWAIYSQQGKAGGDSRNVGTSISRTSLTPTTVASTISFYRGWCDGGQSTTVAWRPAQNATAGGGGASMFWPGGQGGGNKNYYSEDTCHLYKRGYFGSGGGGGCCGYNTTSGTSTWGGDGGPAICIIHLPTVTTSSVTPPQSYSDSDINLGQVENPPSYQQNS